MYSDLLYATPGLQAGDIPKYFKDSSFGVREGDVERRYSPRGDVTIVRDKGFGVPHVYGRDRDGAMFGLGYAAAEDRLFFMDALRNAGRGQLSSFAGGSNTAQDADQWKVAPYTEADLERQTKPPPGFPPALAATIASDADNYIAGINRYITEAKLDPTKLPGEYAAIGRPQGPEPWKRADLVAAASLVGGIFGKGGGEEIAWTQIKHALDARFKRKRARKIFRDFRAAEDPEAPTTVLGRRRFPYQAPPRKLARGSRAIYNRGSLREHEVAAASSGGAAASASAGRKGLLDGLLSFPKAASNAMLVSARESASGKPLMVAGPQVAYFNPQILMEQDVHAPAAAGKPGIDARGASFIGLNLYVQLGRGRDYAWSATSAGQDLIDTYALELCQDARHYRYRGRCEPMEVIERVNRWQPTPGDDTPAGTQTLRALRTKLGLVAGYATVGRKKVVLTRLRSTYFHEIDSAVGFMRFNDPAQIRSAADFQRAASAIGYTFNWFYTDARQIAYFNSGANPARPKGLDPNFPVWGKPRFEWRGFNPDLNTSKLTPFSRHPQVIDQRYLVSWNNKQAKGFRGADSNTFSSAYRSLLLEDRLKALVKGRRKTTLPAMIDAMELAGTTDLRAHVDLAAGAAHHRQAEGLEPAPRGRPAARVAARRRPAAGREQGQGLRARRRDPPDGRLVAAVGARAVPPRAGRQGVQGDRGRRPARQRAQQPRRPPRLGLPDGLVRLRAQGPPHRAQAQGPRPLRAQVLRRRQAPALPPGAAALAARRDPRRPRRRLRRRRGLRRRGPPRRPVVLRRRPPAPGRRRDPAADPLDQPPHLPAGHGDPGHRAALNACGRRDADALGIGLRGRRGLSGNGTRRRLFPPPARGLDRRAGAGNQLAGPQRPFLPPAGGTVTADRRLRKPLPMALCDGDARAIGLWRPQ